MIGSLFSGIGGLELGLERAGLGPVAWQVECDPFCRTVLAKHWPEVDRSVTDVREAGSKTLSRVEVLCGGFPCQDVSSAGKGAGLTGARSGLWYEFERIVGELRPRVVVVENVASGAKLWLPTVRRNLFVLGYDTTAYALSAADVGAPHLRRRIFVVGHANGDGESTMPINGEVAGMCGVASDSSPWATPPQFRGMDDGIPGRMERLRALGNAVVPQCAEVIGRIVRAS